MKMSATNSSLLVKYGTTHGCVPFLLIEKRDRNEDGTYEVLNTFFDRDAVDMWHKLIGLAPVDAHKGYEQVKFDFEFDSPCKKCKYESTCGDSDRERPCDGFEERK